MNGVRVTFEPISIELANECLRSWSHKMGPLERPYENHAHALIDDGYLQAVVTHSTLIREPVGGGLVHLNRSNCIELSRLCAHRPHLCRVALRLWREFVLPHLPQTVAMSYQDADIHSGNTYRFDGWTRVAYSPAGGTDQRSGRKGRNKWIWVWEHVPHPAQPVKHRFRQECLFA